MLKKICLIFTVLFVLTISASELSFDEIKSAYYKSYDYESMEKYEEAINSLNPVYEDFPETYTVNFRLGWLYYLDKKYANAMEHLQKALKISPSSVEAMNTMDLIFAAKEEWKKLEEQAAKIINIDYYNNYANYWYSVALKQQKKYDLAVKVDRKMLVVFPTSVTFLQELGENLFLGGDNEESKSVFYSLIILDPTNVTANAYLKKNEKG